MNIYTTDKIRNVVLLGHGGAGKTSLVEAAAYLAGLTYRMGKVPDGNTARDFGPRLAGYIYGLIKGYDVSTIFSGWQWLMYIVAPCIGAVVGGLFHYGVIVKLLPDEEKE